MKIPTTGAKTKRMRGTAWPGVRLGATACTATKLPTPSSRAALARNARLNSSSVRSEGLPGMPAGISRKRERRGSPRRPAPGSIRLAQGTLIPVRVPGESAADGVREGGGGRPVAAPHVQEELRPEREGLLRETPACPVHQRRRSQGVPQADQVVRACRIEVRIPGEEGVRARIFAPS